MDRGMGVVALGNEGVADLIIDGVLARCNCAVSALCICTESLLSCAVGVGARLPKGVIALAGLDGVMLLGAPPVEGRSLDALVGIRAELGLGNGGAFSAELAAVPIFCANIGVESALRTVCFGTGSIDGLAPISDGRPDPSLASDDLFGDGGEIDSDLVLSAGERGLLALAGDNEVLLAVRARGGGGRDAVGDDPDPIGSSRILDTGDRLALGLANPGERIPDLGVAGGRALNREPGIIERPIAGAGVGLGVATDTDLDPEGAGVALADPTEGETDLERWLGGGVGSGIESMLNPTALCKSAFRHASSSVSSGRGGSASASTAAPTLLSTPNPPNGASEDWTGNWYAGRSTVSVGSIRSTTVGRALACGGSLRLRSSSRARMSISAELAAVTKSSIRSRMTSTRPRRSFSRNDGAVDSGAGHVAVRTGSTGRTTGDGAGGGLVSLGDSGAALLGVRGLPTRNRSRNVGEGVLAGGTADVGTSNESSEWFGLEWAGGRK